MYRRVTVAVRDGINAGVFEDSDRMEAFDVQFAGRYLEAYERHVAGRSTTRSWNIAFDATQDSFPIVVQHPALGMNAHINLDLGITAARIAPGGSLPTLRNDFNQINDILSGLIDDVEERLSRIWPWLRPIDWLAGRFDERLVGFSIDIARNHAWRFAEQLVDLDADGKSELIDRVDKWIGNFGEKVWRPGILPSLGIAAIRLGELGSVDAIIAKLE